MSELNDAAIAALVAQSNLVPTAGEFIPASLQLMEPVSSGETPRYPLRTTTYYQNNGRSYNNNSHDGNRNQRHHHPSSLHEGRSWRNNDGDGSRRSQQLFTSQSNGNSGRNRIHRNDHVQNGTRWGRSDRGYRYQSDIQNGHFYNRTDAVERNDEVSDLQDRKSGNRAALNQNGAYRYNHQNRKLLDESGLNKKQDEKKNKEADRNQMEALIAQLTRGTLECLVCCEPVKQVHATWSCRVCHHVLHLRCVIKWARASRGDDGWRCPACQHMSNVMPSEYRCFCGKVTEPSWNRSECPHSCGGVCGQTRPTPCQHRCTLVCHPGPCPPCQLYATRECGCGRSSRTVPCAESDTVACGSPCGRTLNCSVHKCALLCHIDPCPPCTEIIKQNCFCGRSTQEIICTKESIGKSQFRCGAPCGKKLECANHECALMCHEGPCPPCPLLPAAVKECPCGKAKLIDLDVAPRNSCLDDIPTCKETCGKLLPCGEPGARHECLSQCHEGLCPMCPKMSTVRCRCGHMNKTLLCSELLVRADDARCERKCNKRRSCGKHKCRETCCIDMDHICPLQCTRTLNCGLHKCEESCHSAFCRPCPRDSYTELLCECGAEVILPPVPCGTRRPKCTRPCTRAHSCSHAPTHSCHNEPECPPCTVLVSKYCFGGHELRKAVFCHLKSFSCGIPCGKPMPCGRHTCTLSCHEGECLKDGQTCTQPCTTPRPTCGHNCGVPCHDPPCPDSPCKEMVKVTCECGLRFSTRACIDNAREYQRIVTSQLASKMADLAAGQTVDLNDVATSGKRISYKTLECTEECKVVERNRRLAVGLQIRNPDLSAKLTPRYSDFLRSWAKKDPRFCQNVHEKLTNLVLLAKESKQKSRSYSFESMHREKRQFVHDYCEHFGCESVAYDQEPNRNIVATALKDKSWLPGLSLLEVVQRENGARKVPLPSNSKSKLTSSSKSMEVLSGKVSGSTFTSSPWALPAASGSVSTDYFDFPSPSSSRQPQVDYFDMAPLNE